MALINCPECNKEVSDKAPACPGCGAPIVAAKESSGSGVAELTTVQETSKKFKLQSLISVSLFLLGVFILMLNAGPQDPKMAAAGSWSLLIGVIWYCVNRFRIWWHHK
ncbi:hypothetical protein [Haliea sp. E17]|uniref:hypothetical protein n=1 Tax=Haliea sp. E17 TaxID=3401576 RepID=UPI003AADF74B